LGIRASGTDERNGICALACLGFVKPAMPYNRYFKKLEGFSKRSTYISGTIKAQIPTCWSWSHIYDVPCQHTLKVFSFHS